MVSLALAISVFLWGLEYKLSLYDPPQAASHLVPIAKLLSKNEQPAIPADSIATAPNVKLLAVTIPALAVILLLAACELSLPVYRGAIPPENLPLRNGAAWIFFVRPPPALA
jgi:hypothetical protein